MTLLKFFTAIGIVNSGESYQVKINENFHPFRREVQWARASENDKLIIATAMLA